MKLRTGRISLKWRGRVPETRTRVTGSGKGTVGPDAVLLGGEQVGKCLCVVRVSQCQQVDRLLIDGCRFLLLLRFRSLSFPSPNPRSLAQQQEGQNGGKWHRFPFAPGTGGKGSKRWATSEKEGREKRETSKNHPVWFVICREWQGGRGNERRRHVTARAWQLHLRWRAPR